ncbi:MAG: chromosomal replication initiator protein DnaA [Tannerellaceae bacterium]|jgi:chromosomal replication initiator protein|nr:chromosomal replication initiator protein DnaA [Tannerellaceae bacterium]
MNSFQTLWGQCLSVIQDIVPAAVFDTWFKPIVPLSYKGNTFTIQVPSQFFYEYLEDKYANVLKLTIDRVIGTNAILNYRIMVDKSTGGTVDYPTGSQQTPTAITKNAGKAPAAYAQATAPQDLSSQLIPKYSFDNFFEGATNRLVRMAGEKVAENPGKTAFNPLFIFGPSGVGKTHLCHAIGLRIKELHPELKVLYIAANTFREQFVDATRKNTSNDFMFFYQSLDVLILDDIQELIGMDKTQSAFFHIFNHLHQLNKQLVLTSDKTPADLQGMEERMISRLRWGLTAELHRPDPELRKTILRKKAIASGLKIPEDVIELIADKVTQNVRELEGVLVSLHAGAVLNNSEINTALALQILNQSQQRADIDISVQGVNSTVCNYFHIDSETFHSKKKKHEIVQARQISMYLSNKYTHKSLSYIGKLIGNKDHATVVHGINVVKKRMEVDRAFRTMVEEIERRLKK